MHIAKPISNMQIEPLATAVKRVKLDILLVAIVQNTIRDRENNSKWVFTSP